MRDNRTLMNRIVKPGIPWYVAVRSRRPGLARRQPVLVQPELEDREVRISE
jgi:hypothetical protein